MYGAGVILPSSCPFKATAGTVSTATIWGNGDRYGLRWPSAPIRILGNPAAGERGTQLVP